jgi:hypothetical protein
MTLAAATRTAVSDDHDVVRDSLTQIEGLDTDFGRCDRSHLAWSTGTMHHGREIIIVTRVRVSAMPYWSCERAGAHPGARDQERELPDLGERTHQPWRDAPVTEDPREPSQNQSLDRHDERHRRQHDERTSDQIGGIEQHPRRGEEQQPEHVAQRDDLPVPVAEFGLAQDHSRDERGECEREAEQVRSYPIPTPSATTVIRKSSRDPSGRSA